MAFFAEGLVLAEAATTTIATPSLSRPIYEAPMRVVIVRNSDPMCEPNCPQWVSAEGEIMVSSPQLFRRVFKQMGKAKLPVIIRSPGGSIEAALSIGRMIRERGLTVAVGYTRYIGCSPADSRCRLPQESQGIYTGVIEEDRAFCNSACPMLLAGGTTRMASYRTYVGVHQPRTIWTHKNLRYRKSYRVINGKKHLISRTVVARKNVEDRITYGIDERLRKMLTSYYSAMGIGLVILDETGKATFEQMNFLSQQQNDQLNLRTTPLRATFLGLPGLCGATATSAICVEDKARDPIMLAALAMKVIGIDTDDANMTFRLAQLQDVACKISCPVWIAAEGTIVPDTPQDFQTFLQQQNLPAVSVIFHSSGGDAAAAIELGRMIRNANLETSFGRTVFSQMADPQLKPVFAVIDPKTFCNGACVLAYSGGRQRHANADSSVILHNPQLYAKPSQPWLPTNINLYFIEMGVQANLMSTLYNVDGKSRLKLKRRGMLLYSISTDSQNVLDLLSPMKCQIQPLAMSCLATKQ